MVTFKVKNSEFELEKSFSFTNLDVDEYEFENWLSYAMLYDFEPHVEKRDKSLFFRHNTEFCEAMCCFLMSFVDSKLVENYLWKSDEKSYVKVEVTTTTQKE